MEPLWDEAVTSHIPSRLIYDKAADGDALRERLAQWGVDIVCPRHKNRVRKRKQDGRKLRRCRRRWTVERTVAWLQAFKRLVVRDEFYAHLYTASSSSPAWSSASDADETGSSIYQEMAE